MGASCTQLLGSPLETRASSLPGSRPGIQVCTSPLAELLPESSLLGGPPLCLQSHLACRVTPVGPDQASQGAGDLTCAYLGRLCESGGIKGAEGMESEVLGGRGREKLARAPKSANEGRSRAIRVGRKVRGEPEAEQGQAGRPGGWSGGGLGTGLWFQPLRAGSQAASFLPRPQPPTLK